MADPFRIDIDYDRTHAGDGVSRYGVYLDIQDRLFRIYDVERDQAVTPDPVQFACAAWHVASPPNMAPGYVQHHPRIQAVTLNPTWDTDDRGGAVLADLTVTVLGPPPDLRGILGWTGWRTEHGAYVPPAPADLVRRGAMLPSVRLLFCLPAAELYAPRDAPDRLTLSDATAAVARLVELLNAQVRPVLNRLEGGL